jgi:hypothetical protein
MSTKDYTVAGISNQNGQLKIRLANNLNRARVLAKNGHTEIQLFEMPFPGQREDAVDFLLSKDLGAVGNQVVREAARELGFIIKDTAPQTEMAV